MSRLVIFLIHVYRWCVSPFIPPSCRFDPTCSRYAIYAFTYYGFFGEVFGGFCVD